MFGGSCGIPLSTPHNTVSCVVLITECHNFHKYSQSPLTTCERTVRHFAINFSLQKKILFMKSNFICAKSIVGYDHCAVLNGWQMLSM